MANNRKVYGFRPVGGWGHAASLSPHPIPIASAYDPDVDATGTTIGLSVGDPVNIASTGTVELANLGEAIYGVIAGFTPYWNGSAMTPTNYWPNGTSDGGLLARRCFALVVPATACLWEIDCDDASTATTEAAYQLLVGLNADHSCTGDTTNSSRPTANPMLDISTAATGSAGWRIIGVSQTMENVDYSGLYTKLIVRVNETEESPDDTTGV